MTGIPTRLPPGYLLYGRSPDFTADSLPDALRAGHATKPGVWGLLRVTEGSVRFELEPPLEGGVVARAGKPSSSSPKSAITSPSSNPAASTSSSTAPLTARTPLDDTCQP